MSAPLHGWLGQKQDQPLFGVSLATPENRNGDPAIAGPPLECSEMSRTD
jgi:hypothetical protein